MAYPMEFRRLVAAAYDACGSSADVAAQYGCSEAKICAKDANTYEMYLLSAPNAASICVGNNCVGQNSGFASVKYPS